MNAAAGGDLSAATLAEFGVRFVATTRWSDNDMYGHLNNAVYYELFDAAINGWLAERQEAFETTDVIGVVAESACRFFGELAFPGEVTVALAVARLGNSSVTYRLGLFDGADPAEDAPAAAVGHWVHVYLDRQSRQSVPIPAALRELMATQTR